MAERALIVGAGPGLGAALCRRFQAEGLAVGLAARDVAKLEGLGDWRWGVDAADFASVADLFRAADDQFGVADVVVYNAGARLRGATLELDPDAVKRALEVTAFGGCWWRSRRSGACWRRARARSSSPGRRRA